MAANSSTVDISRLPAPTIVEQLAFDTIVAAIVADLQARLPSFDATVESDPAYKVIEACAYREQLLRREFQDAALQLLVAYATGANLDALAAVFGVSRLLVTPADAITGTAAVYEADDSLRQRVILAPASYSVAGPELAYVAHAASASADVLDASATSPAPGEVLVSVLSAVGDGTASDALVANGIAGGEDGPVRRVERLSRRVQAAIATGAAVGTLAGPAHAAAPPPGRAVGGPAPASHYEVHFHPSAGMDEQALFAKFERWHAEQERKKGAAARSGYGDTPDWE